MADDSSKPPKKPYEVGYGKPPKHTRFRKGRSGNPKGRPKGSQNFKTVVEEIVKMPTPIRLDGAKTKTVSTIKATLLRLREKALKGDIRAIMELLGLAASALPADGTDAASTPILPDDEAIIKAYVERLSRKKGPEEGGGIPVPA